jgi:hypothetical protein
MLVLVRTMMKIWLAIPSIALWYVSLIRITRCLKPMHFYLISESVQKTTRRYELHLTRLHFEWLKVYIFNLFIARDDAS